jgi:hypothetical protein
MSKSKTGSKYLHHGADDDLQALLMERGKNSFLPLVIYRN